MGHHDQNLTRYAWLSIAAAVFTILLKGMAYLLTGSVGLLSDAVESLVNLAAAIIALGALMVAAQPPDADHDYGHGKIEYFSSGAEGLLILFAALSIGAASVQRLLSPQPVEQLGIGLLMSLVASVLNLGVARTLLRAGKRYHSITLEADAQHLMTDVWTSAGVLVGIAGVGVTGWHWLDPVLALLVAVNITRAGITLVRRSALGLLDTKLPDGDLAQVRAVLDQYTEQGVAYHALRSRQSGAWRFVAVHILVPDWWTVQRGHDLLEQVEHDVREAMPRTSIFTHLEPLNDPASFEDESLARVQSGTLSTL